MFISPTVFLRFFQSPSTCLVSGHAPMTSADTPTSIMRPGFAAASPNKVLRHYVGLIAVGDGLLR